MIMPQNIGKVTSIAGSSGEVRVQRDQDRGSDADAFVLRTPQQDGEDSESPAEASPPAAGGVSDTFSHVDEAESEYTDYNMRGRYISDGTRILPRRYYQSKLEGEVCYNGDVLTDIAFLEGAVRSGEIALDESRSVEENLRRAQKLLIEGRAVPLYPWSTTLYSEDLQLRFLVVDGEISDAVRAFYYSGDGRKITAIYLAEQLAFGLRPEALDGDYEFLERTDAELCAKAFMLGKAARIFRGTDDAYRQQTISENQYLEDIHLYLIYYLGRDEGHKSAAQLRDILADPQFAKKALKGQLQAAAPSAVYRRPMTKAGIEAALRDAARRRYSRESAQAQFGEEHHAEGTNGV